jgi:hypothetical protein
MENEIGLLYLLNFLWKIRKQKKLDFFYFMVGVVHLYSENKEFLAKIFEELPRLAEAAMRLVT